MGRRSKAIAGIAVALALCVAVVAVVLTRGRSGSDRPTIGAAGFEERFAAFKPAPEPNGDLSRVVWPSYVTDAEPLVKRLYEFQITHGELMRYMPCFCGCGDFAGHRSNRDCYVRRVNRDGSVVFDDMAPT
jgi:hypothetical protein